MKSHFFQKSSPAEMHIIIIISHHPKKFGTRSWVAFSLAYRSVINLSELFFGVEKQVRYSNSFFTFDISINLQFLYNQILVRRHSAGLIFSNVKILKSVAHDSRQWLPTRSFQSPTVSQTNRGSTFSRVKSTCYYSRLPNNHTQLFTNEISYFKQALDFEIQAILSCRSPFSTLRFSLKIRSFKKQNMFYRSDILQNFSISSF